MHPHKFLEYVCACVHLMCIITLNGDLVHLFINRNIWMPVLKCTFVEFSTVLGQIASVCVCECIYVSSINEKYDNGFSFGSGKTCWLKMFSEIRWNIHGNAANRYDMFNDSWNTHTTHIAHTDACTQIHTQNQRNGSIIINIWWIFDCIL